MLSLSSEGVARASPAFPGTLQRALELDQAPSCTICHSTPNGGFGTATTRFAEYLEARGLRAGNEASLERALAAAEGERHDSDGDGRSDLDALQAGADPNGSLDVPPFEAGCQASVAGTVQARAIWVTLLALAGWCARGRRRRPLHGDSQTGSLCSRARRSRPRS
jgi:hypothetical protein